MLGSSTLLVIFLSFEQGPPAMKPSTHAPTIGPKSKSLPPIDSTTNPIRPGFAVARFCSSCAWPTPTAPLRTFCCAKSTPGFQVFVFES